MGARNVQKWLKHSLQVCLQSSNYVCHNVALRFKIINDVGQYFFFLSGCHGHTKITKNNSAFSISEPRSQKIFSYLHNLLCLQLTTY
jgi:ribosome-associated toxin RatA of RatAB toxin-antitoxin module